MTRSVVVKRRFSGRAQIVYSRLQTVDFTVYEMGQVVWKYRQTRGAGEGKRERGKGGGGSYGDSQENLELKLISLRSVTFHGTVESSPLLLSQQ